MSDPRRTVLVTGATEGIGYETARRLAALEAKVVLHARTPQEGEDALDRLIRAGIDPLRLHVVTADFARLSEVDELAARVRAAHPRIDVLINNAAVSGPQSRIITEDGNEITFQVNYLAPYLLTRLLWGPLTVSGNGRVVNLSSILHRSGTVHWGDLSYNRRYAPGAVYAQSKLALTLFTKGLAEYGRSGPTAVAVHPGIIATGMLSRYGGRVGAPVTEGAAAVVHLAAPEVPVVNGGYYNVLSPANPAPLVHDRGARPRAGPSSRNRHEIAWLSRVLAESANGYSPIISLGVPEGPPANNRGSVSTRDRTALSGLA
jgi:NAD(P)-dependent dehydrogenase (short-subunit alcohol dehydrogenase family)